MKIPYAINDIYPCIQGEGYHAGEPMALIRLQGCGVGCPWCDTKETWGIDARNQVLDLVNALGTSPLWAWAHAADVAAIARREGPAVRWALVTGGEPAEQDLAELCDALHAADFGVAVETSGTALGVLGAGVDWLTVSPKLGMPGARAVLPEVLAEADEIKCVVCKPADLARYDALLAGCEGGYRADAVLSLQPVAGSEKAARLCHDEAIRRGWRLSIQSHKVIGAR